MTQQQQPNEGGGAAVDAPKREVVPWNKDTTFPVELIDTARMIAASGYYPDIRSVAQAAFKLAVGRERGFGIIESMNEIHVIQSKNEDGSPKGPPKIQLGYKLQASLVMRSGRYRYRWETTPNDRQEARVAFFDDMMPGANQKLGVSVFTIGDAESAGLIRKWSNWEKWPAQMLRARAMTNGVAAYCPSVLMGAEPTADLPYIEATSYRVRDDDEPVPEETHGEPVDPWPGFWARNRDRGFDHAAVHAFVGVGEEDGALKDAIEQKAHRENKTVAQCVGELEDQIETEYRRRQSARAPAPPDAPAPARGEEAEAAYSAVCICDGEPSPDCPVHGEPPPATATVASTEGAIPFEAGGDTPATDAPHPDDPWAAFWKNVEGAGIPRSYVLTFAKMADEEQLKVAVRQRAVKEERSVADIIQDLQNNVADKWQTEDDELHRASRAAKPKANH